MEHPFYSLSKKPETTVRMYRNGDQWLKVTPSVNGLATIYDKDILIYCISQIMAKLKKGEKVSKRVRINSRDLLVFTNRGTAGKDYEALQDAIERIRGTTITTNIRTGDEEQTDTFGLIDASSIRRKHGLDGRLQSCEITLSDWVFNAIEHNEVLTLHRDYFRLRKPIERRIYELGRKHCGQQPSFKISLEQLHKKSGSKSSDFEFRRAVRGLAASDHLPDYRVEFDAKADMVMFINRNTMKIGTGEEEDEPWAGALRPDYDAIRAAAPGWDPRYLEEQFRAWLTKKERIPKQPEKMFIKFATTWFSNNGRPK
jgi:plasmid replication initiation protein